MFYTQKYFLLFSEMQIIDILIRLYLEIVYLLIL